MILITINKVAHNNCIVCYKTIQSLCKVTKRTLADLLKDKSISIIIIDTKRNIELPKPLSLELAVPIIDIEALEKVDNISILRKYPNLIERSMVKKHRTARRLAFTDKRNLLRAKQKRINYRCHDD